MKKILFGVTVPMTANAFLKPQLKDLIADGWDVHIACDSSDEIKELIKIPGLQVHTLPMRREPSPLRDLIALYRWVVLLKKLKPQIVIGSTPKAAFLSMLGSALGKVPIRIYHARGFRAEGLSGVAKRISLITEKITIKLATEVICDSYSLKNSLINYGCLSKNSGIVLGKGSCCGVDTNFFRPPNSSEKELVRRMHGFTNEDFVIGFVGRLTADKGINELIRAATELNKINKNVKTAIVGPHEKNLPLSKYDYDSTGIRFFNETQDVRSFYWAFDVFILPSYREGFPIAPLEAQSCGLALITTNVTGCIDSQPAVNSSLTVLSKNHRAIMDAALALIEEPMRLKELGANARSWVKENFEAQQVREMHIGFLNQQLRYP